jgi:hypothetical protein
MYINPILFGVLTTLFAEIVTVNLCMIALYAVKTKRNKRTTKGGKYNG